MKCWEQAWIIALSWIKCWEQVWIIALSWVKCWEQAWIIVSSWMNEFWEPAWIKYISVILTVKKNGIYSQCPMLAISLFSFFFSVESLILYMWVMFMICKSHRCLFSSIPLSLNVIITHTSRLNFHVRAHTHMHTHTQCTHIHMHMHTHTCTQTSFYLCITYQTNKWFDVHQINDVYYFFLVKCSSFQKQSSALQMKDTCTVKEICWSLRYNHNSFTDNQGE